MFGLVTKRQLEQHAEDLRREVERSRRDMEELKLEWMSWYDKFKMLLHRWTKRDKGTSPSGEGPPQNGDEGEPETLPRPHVAFPHSRRGF